jgi:hypothetical protein
MTTKDVKVLEVIYDTANPQLLAFEKERATFFADLGSRWDGQVFGYNAGVSLIDLKMDGFTATARIYETIHLQWVPKPTELPASLLSERQQNPEAYAPTVPRGSHGEIVSGMGVRHEVTLEKGNSGWRLVKDAFEEPTLFGASPDLEPGSWAAVWLGILPNTALTVGNIPVANDNTSDTMVDPFAPDIILAASRTNAVNYAKAVCRSYNSSYCNFNPCGGDCANFVSQCLFNGGQTKDDSWKTYSGKCGKPDCPAGSSANAGTDTWANNRMLRDHFINKRKAVAKPDIFGIGAGDIVNYVTRGYTDWNHVTIVTESAGGTSGGLICSHNPDLCNAPWILSNYSPSSYSYTALVW